MSQSIKSHTDLIWYAEHDPKFIVESGFYVTNKDKEVVPFIFNDLQNQFYEERTSRDDILKPGQIGFSTMILALFTVKFIFIPNAWCVSISHEAEATLRLFSKVDFWLNPKYMAPWLRPYVQLSKDKDGNIVNGPTNSRFYIGTAGANAFGRGDTIHYAHLSEISRWKDSGRLVTGILRAVPLKEDSTWIIKETTANGFGTYHHTEWEREKKGLETTDVKMKFTPHFYPVFKHKEYRIEDAVINPDTYTEKELYYLRKYPDHVDDAFLQWRREMIGQLNSEDGRSSEEMFMQEFPLEEEEAFLHSGNPIFSPEIIQEYKINSTPAIAHGNLVGIPPQQIFEETDRGWLHLYQIPHIDGRYVIFADTAENGDACSAHIYDRKTHKLAGHYHAHINANYFGDELNRIGHFFNKALIAVEINNMGYSTRDRLINLNYPYLYKRRRYDKKTKKETEEFGWYTDRKTKPLIIGHMQNLLRTGEADIPDEPTLIQMQFYIRHENGTMGAVEGKEDDRVISVCGVHYVMKEHPYIAPANQAHKVERKVAKFKSLRSSPRIRRSGY